MSLDDYAWEECVDMEVGRLVFEPRESLSETERERADLHVGCCLSCQLDMYHDYLMDRIEV
jgi:hypothetical protein